MGKEAVFTMKLEHDLRADFVAEAEAVHRPASQIMRELMREFIKSQREQRAYAAFLQNKVDVARASVRAGIGHGNDAVEADFAARRAKATGAA